jgi:hypothetical protein
MVRRDGGILGERLWIDAIRPFLISLDHLVSPRPDRFVLDFETRTGLLRFGVALTHQYVLVENKQIARDGAFVAIHVSATVEVLSPPAQAVGLLAEVRELSLGDDVFRGQATVDDEVRVTFDETASIADVRR